MGKEISYLTNSAVKVDGRYIEEVIPGYATLSSAGRETLARTYETESVADVDGDNAKDVRYPGRVITVGFLIRGGDLNAKMEQLSKLLSSNGSEFIFNDEADKYFYGIAVMPSEVEKGQGFVTGEYQIFCPDPFKYAVEETGPISVSTAYDTSELDEYDSTQTYNSGDMVKRQDGGVWKAYECNADGTTGTWTASNWSAVQGMAFAVNNDGGYKTYPRFEVSFGTSEDASGNIGTSADCGFIQFAKDGEPVRRIQFGDDEEEQVTPTKAFDVNFTKNTLGGFSNASSGTYLSWKDDANVSASSSGIKPSYGNSSGWHGSFIRKTITTADVDFSFSFKQLISVTDKKQKFGFMAVLLDASDNIVAGVMYKKSSSSSTKGTVSYIVDGETIKSKTVDFKKTGKFGYSYDKKKKKYSVRGTENTIKRNAEGKITFKLACNSSSVVGYSDALTSVKKVGFFFVRYGKDATKKGQSPNPDKNILRAASFSYGEEENSFSSGDVLIVNCSDASVLLNDGEEPSLGDVGNEWSDFYLDVGQNTIFVAHSDWVLNGYEPDVKMYYRKRWL